MSYFGISNDIDSLFLESSLFNNIDEDNNLCIDDILGWDATMGEDSNPNPPIATTSYFTHGTHVAGISGAKTSGPGNSGNGIASIGWNTSIIPVKCKADTSMDLSSLQSVIAGTEYAIHANADIINMSWGTTSYISTLEDLMIEADSRGIILVAAAGNDGENVGFASIKHYPAAYDNVISVGASNELDIRAAFSCYGSNSEKWVDLMAPGTNIQSCLANGPNSYGIKDGTSMASPLVAGVCALMKAYCPSCTPDQIENCLFETCDPMPNEVLFNPILDSSRVGHGRVNVFDAISCLSSINPVAEFSSGVDFICAGTSSIDFFDESSGYITSWQWSSPNSFVSFSSTTQQNPTVTILATSGTTFTIVLAAYNDSVGSSDTISHSFIVTTPEASIIYPDTITDCCNSNSSYFLVEFINANSPYEITYTDNYGGTYTETNITQNPALISISPIADTFTSYSLSLMQSYLGCTGIVSGSVGFNSQSCDCSNSSVNNHWAFGSKVGIQFEPTINDPVAGPYALPVFSSFSTTEGTASISDSNGDLIFCSDANNIYDKTFNIMQNGGSISGNSAASQAAVILPKSIADSTYYLFTVEDQIVTIGQPTIWMNVIDMSLPGNNGGTINSPNGSVVLGSQPLETGGVMVSEKLTWVKHGSNANNFWLITHSNQGSTFLVYLVSPDSVSLNNVITVPGSCNITSNQGFLRSNLNGNLLAAVYYIPGCLELYSFNNQTGNISLLKSESTTYQSFGLEFSPNSGYLYFTQPTQSIIKRYTVSELSPYLYSLTTILNTGNYTYGLQLTPDHQQIYVGHYWGEYIGSFESPDLANPSFNSSVLVLANNTSTRRCFPQLVPSTQIELFIINQTDDCNNSCLGNVTVGGSSACPSLTYQWNDVSLQTGPTASGLCAGIYNVIATDSCGCTRTLEVIISENSVAITDIIAPTTCATNNNDFIDITIDATYYPITYTWSNGATTEDISNLTQGAYSVTVTDSHGCISMANIFVYPNSLELGNDTILCISNLMILDATMDSASYLWSTGETTPTIIASESNYYFVEVTQGNCIFYDTISILYDSPLTIDLPDTVIICDSIPVELSAGDVYADFLWMPTGETTPEIMVNISDMYILTASNGCGDFVDSTWVEVIQSPVIELGDDTVICSGDSLLLLPQYSGLGDLLWSTGETTQEIFINNEGEYSVTISNACGEYSDTIYLSTQINNFEFSEDTLFMYGGQSIIIDVVEVYYSYNWSTGESTQSIIVTDPDTYWVTVTDTIGCAASDSIIVARPYSIIIPSSFQNIKIYPNPVSSELTIEGLKEDDEVRIFDVLGKEQPYNKLSNHPFILDLKNQYNGVYLLRIKRNNEVRVFKIVKR